MKEQEAREALEAFQKEDPEGYRHVLKELADAVDEVAQNI